MSTSSASNPWLPLRTPGASTRVRLFCFPHAGGAASSFRRWGPSLEPDVEVCAVEYPGRWNRHREPVLESVADLVRAVRQGLDGLFEQPYAFFGYSYGTVIAFELARALRAAGNPGPQHLIVGARWAPHLPLKHPPIHALPDSQFLAMMDRRYGGLPAVIRDDPDLLALAMPALRGDLTALETYAYSEQSPLDCPITALAGRDDRMMEADGIAAWAKHTSVAFASHSLAGGHFFINDSADRVLQLVRAALADTGALA